MWESAAAKERWICINDAPWRLCWIPNTGDHGRVWAAVSPDVSMSQDEIAAILVTRGNAAIDPSDLRDILSELRLLDRVTRVITVPGADNGT